MSIALIKSIQNFFHLIVNEAEAEIFIYGTPTWEFVKKNGGPAALALGETFLLGAAAGTPWTTLIAQFEVQALAAGLQIAKGAGAVILNLAQSNGIAKGILASPVATAP